MGMNACGVWRAAVEPRLWLQSHSVRCTGEFAGAGYSSRRTSVGLRRRKITVAPSADASVAAITRTASVRV